jgi:tetratricopeptide (TPR) repeat protein
MAEWHLSADLFRRFLDGRAKRDESKQIVRHLVRGCDECQALASRLVAESGYWFPKGSFAASEEAYEGAFEAAFSFTTKEERRIAVERLLGWGQWAAVEPLLPEERRALVIGDRDYHHWGFYRALLDAAHSYGFTDPREGVNIVELALVVSELLSVAEVGGEEAATDMRAKGYAILGNARRLASDLPGARQAINEAWRLNEDGTGDPLERAQLISFDASYIRMMGEFETAEAALEEALRIYRAAGDRHMQGRTLIKMGDAIGYVNPERAILHLRRAVDLINPLREPRLELCAQLDLTHFLSDAGRPEEALALLDRTRPLYKQFPDHWMQLRLHWLEGRIARALGHLDEAAHIFRQVWEGFRERELHYDLVMASIDLVETCVVQGNHETAARLAADVYAVMKTWGLHRHALAAWLMLENALELRQAEELFGKIRVYFSRRWHNPVEFLGE